MPDYSDRDWYKAAEAEMEATGLPEDEALVAVLVRNHDLMWGEGIPWEAYQAVVGIIGYDPRTECEDE